MKLVLMGLRGSGKSTLGRMLAQRRGLRFVDLDARTPAILGSGSVAEAWARHGEAGFRVAEAAALRGVIQEDPDILALGGGTPTAPGAEQLIQELKGPPETSPRLVYLRATADQLADRIRAGGLLQRPSLTGTDPISEIEAVLAARDPLYRQLADAVVEVGDLDIAGALAALDALMHAG